MQEWILSLKIVLVLLQLESLVKEVLISSDFILDRIAPILFVVLLTNSNVERPATVIKVIEIRSSINI